VLVFIKQVCHSTRSTECEKW